LSRPELAFCHFDKRRRLCAYVRFVFQRQRSQIEW
jgi:hypothetical protein